MSEWISTKERIPEKDGTYLTVYIWRDKYHNERKGVLIRDFGDVVGNPSGSTFGMNPEDFIYNGKAFGELWADADENGWPLPNGEYHIDDITEVLYWMPIPEIPED